MNLGNLKIDPVAYGSQGSAILGIRDSGKTYTATVLAERLFEAGIPFTAFDPIGVWRFLRVPGKGRGYPVVVAGGQEGDLPLTPRGAPAIVEAAMRNGVSLIIDLFSLELSKKDWRTIVGDSVRLMLHRNQPYGLRHIFIEEAAEFCPQIIPRDGVSGQVYAEIEKLARMGGNSRLGYTLINQRAEQVNKAVLELCDNLLLHRQKGKNSLLSLTKWLDAGNVRDHRAIIDGLSTLPTGECWAWMAGMDHAELVKVPEKNSLHPDRRVMRGDAEAEPVQAVDVGAFVSQMREALVEVEEEAKANDPRHLRAEIARLTKDLQAARAEQPAIDPAALEEAEQRGYDRAFEMGMNALGAYSSEVLGIHTALKTAMDDFDVLNWNMVDALDGRTDRDKPSIWDDMDALNRLDRRCGKAATTVPAPPPQNSGPKVPKSTLANTDTARPRPAPTMQNVVPEHSGSDVAPSRAESSGGLSPTQRKIIDAVAEMEAVCRTPPPRVLVAMTSGYKNVKSHGFAKALSGLSAAGLVEYPDSGRVTLSGEGRRHAAPCQAPMTHDELRERIAAVLGPTAGKLIKVISSTYPHEIERTEVAAQCGYQNVKSHGFAKTLSRLSSLGLVEYPNSGTVRAADILFP